MKRLVNYHLLEWKQSSSRKPLLLRGARQVGKTYTARQLGRHFESFVEVNFETDKELQNICEQNLDPERIIQRISLEKGKKITPGKTLLFFDEIQAVPEALTALRYFYEKLPQQHIIAAGSLLDFATKLVGIPVGRVSSLYMYPLSFLEFLCAREYQILAQALLTCSPQKPMDHAIHQKLLRILGEYFALGGMPEAVASWQERHDTRLCREIHNTLIDTYKQDFNKYAARYQIKYLEALFNAVPRQLGKKFKYSAMEGDYRKRELVPCLELLATAGIVYQIMRSAGNGIPLGAEIDASDFKAILLDVALNQTTLGLNVKEWLLTPETEFINKGALIEAFVGQELLAYAPPSQKASLFYWRRNVTGSEAEIDYLIQDKGHVVPVEVKSGAGSTLKSMRMFLDSHPQSPYGIRFSSNNYSDYGNIHSYPLYAIPCLLTQNQAIDVKTYEALVV